MATVNISLSRIMREWVDKQVDTGLYANNSDYIRDLIRRDQLRAQKIAILQHAISEGLESGDAGPLDIKAIQKSARKKAGILVGD